MVALSAEKSVEKYGRSLQSCLGQHKGFSVTSSNICNKFYNSFLCLFKVLILLENIKVHGRSREFQFQHFNGRRLWSCHFLWEFESIIFVLACKTKFFLICYFKKIECVPQLIDTLLIFFPSFVFPLCLILDSFYCYVLKFTFSQCLIWYLTHPVYFLSHVQIFLISRDAIWIFIFSLSLFNMFIFTFLNI